MNNLPFQSTMLVVVVVFMLVVMAIAVAVMMVMFSFHVVVLLSCYFRVQRYVYFFATRLQKCGALPQTPRILRFTFFTLYVTSFQKFTFLLFLSVCS
jgi:hypothetical protein